MIKLKRLYSEIKLVNKITPEIIVNKLSDIEPLIDNIILNNDNRKLKQWLQILDKYNIDTSDIEENEEMIEYFSEFNSDILMKFYQDLLNFFQK